MKRDQTVQETTETLPPTPNKSGRETPTPEPAGAAWQFRVLMVVIALCVLMLVGKVFGLF